MSIFNSFFKDVYDSNPKPQKPTIKRKFGKPVHDKNGLVDKVDLQMQRETTGENTLTNEELHDLQSGLK